MIRKATIAVILAAATLTTACNTVKGLGRDIESVGQKGEEVISHAPVESDQEARSAR